MGLLELTTSKEKGEYEMVGLQGSDPEEFVDEPDLVDDVPVRHPMHQGKRCKICLALLALLVVVVWLALAVALPHDGSNLSRNKDTQSLPAHYPYNLKEPVPTDYNFKEWTAPGGNRFTEYIAGDAPLYLGGFRNNETLLAQSDALARSRRYHVKEAMKGAYHAYEKYAFGNDELMPISRKPNDRWGGLGTTMVDALDTLWVMGLKEEFHRATSWIQSDLSFKDVQEVNVFEMTIRDFGGLLSAYDLSGEAILLEKATELGHKLFQAYTSSKSNFPLNFVNLKTGQGHDHLHNKFASTAEIGTSVLEYRYLSKVTNQSLYADASEKAMQTLHEMKQDTKGLYSMFIRDSQSDQPSYFANLYNFGASVDSFYEYMLKAWLQSGRTEEDTWYREMYDESIQAMHDHLLQKTTPSGWTYIGQQYLGFNLPAMEHLACFMGGLLALGAYTDPLGLESERAQRDLTTARALTYTCYQMYAKMDTGLSPESVNFIDLTALGIGKSNLNPPLFGNMYILRPEVVESFYVLHHLTKDPIYREWGWEIFSAIECYCKTDVSGAYGTFPDVNDANAQPEDSMESFFLAETLKYLYLLFDPDSEIDLLNKHVFNTECHPTRMFPVMDRESNQQPRGGGNSTSRR